MLIRIYMDGQPIDDQTALEFVEFVQEQEGLSYEEVCALNRTSEEWDEIRNEFLDV